MVYGTDPGSWESWWSVSRWARLWAKWKETLWESLRLVMQWWGMQWGHETPPG